MMKSETLSPYHYWGESNWAIKKRTNGEESYFQAWLWYTIGHRMPNWMPLKLHLILENMLESLPDPLRTFPIIAQSYHLLHGLLCGFSMEIIVPFLREVETTLSSSYCFMVLDEKLADKSAIPEIKEIVSGQVMICDIPRILVEAEQ